MARPVCFQCCEAVGSVYFRVRCATVSNETVNERDMLLGMDSPKKERKYDAHPTINIYTSLSVDTLKCRASARVKSVGRARACTRFRNLCEIHMLYIPTYTSRICVVCTRACFGWCQRRVFYVCCVFAFTAIIYTRSLLVEVAAWSPICVRLYAFVIAVAAAAATSKWHALLRARDLYLCGL